MRISSLLAAAAALAFACSLPPARAQEDLASVDPTLAATPLPAPQTVAPEAVLKMVQEKDASITLVDTQPVEGYADGHLPGAVSFPWVMRITKFPIALPRNKTLVFYGSCPNDTSDMIKQLSEFGYFNVKVMDGGWYKWIALKYPAEGKGDYAQAHPATQQPAGEKSISAQPPASHSIVAQTSPR
jgi:3-mercaptopyruvate sulfurtransferase SseA